MKILVINGPNLNMLGIREPDVYGQETYDSLVEKIKAYCDGKGIEVQFVQSNHEGALVDAIQGAYGCMDGIVINPGAYTHTNARHCPYTCSGSKTFYGATFCKYNSRSEKTNTGKNI